ncbi:hypothetical protein [Labrys monachus]|uniref:Uncharacterized protein n=1 Tax=Labrys monachus TaxID=217067 RepID=A0ABU0FDI5_9HYPH|nr:hypothetical protein [Labrys monachus]MDQ0392664.1 hypothetical protein [Labrys monachus]
MTDREKLSAAEIERICLYALRASPGLADIEEVRVGPLSDSSGFTWKLISITPVPEPIAYDNALHAIRPIQGAYDLLGQEP